MEVRAGTAPFPDDAARVVGEKAHRLGTAGIDAENMHGRACSMLGLLDGFRSSTASRSGSELVEDPSSSRRATILGTVPQPGLRTSRGRGEGLMATDEARRVLLDAIAARVFPSAVVHVGSSGGPLWRDRLGTRTFEAESAPVTQTTAYDLASLTKPIATTTVVMDLVRRGALRLDERLAACFSEWRGVDRESVAVRDLLEHSSGLPARLVDPPPAGRREFEHDICTMPLEYAPRTRSVYSDLGFILLGLLAEQRAGAHWTRRSTGFNIVLRQLTRRSPPSRCRSG